MGTIIFIINQHNLNIITINIQIKDYQDLKHSHQARHDVELVYLR